MTSRGVFISFEGGEGCGKSTQIGRLARTLSSAGLIVETLREPGATRLGELVRGVLLDPSHGEMDARAELLLYEAARAQMTAERILPALALGKVVLCDRYFDSSTAYQGYGRELRIDDVKAMNAFATAGCEPDLTILLDIDPGLGVARATTGGADRLEAAGDAFHERVRGGYLRLAEENSGRIVLADASGTPDEVEARVLAAVRERVPVLALALGEAGL